MAQNASRSFDGGRVRIQHVSDGWHSILCSSAVAGMVDEVGRGIAGAAGEGFSDHGHIGGFGGGRYMGTVDAATKEARMAEATDKVLTQAVH